MNVAVGQLGWIDNESLVEVGRLRSTLVRIAEVLEDEGRTDSEAYSFAQAAVDEPEPRPHQCDQCGARFRWPGELADHRRNLEDHQWWSVA